MRPRGDTTQIQSSSRMACRPAVSGCSSASGSGRRHAPLQDRWLGLGIAPGRRHQGGGRNASDGFRPSRGAIPDMVAQFRKPYRPLLDEFMIMQVFVDDDVDHRQRLLGRKGEFAIRAADDRVVAPEQDRLRTNGPVVIPDHETAVRQLAHRDPRNEAVGQPRLIPVRGAERVREPDDVQVMVPAGALPERDAFRPRLAPDPVQSRRDVAQRRVPAHARPAPLAPRPRPAQRMHQAIRMVHDAWGCESLAAHLPPVEREIRVRPHANHAPIGDGQQDAAAAVTDAAHALVDLFRHDPRRGRPSPGNDRARFYSSGAAVAFTSPRAPRRAGARATCSARARSAPDSATHRASPPAPRPRRSPPHPRGTVHCHTD